MTKKELIEALNLIGNDDTVIFRADKCFEGMTEIETIEIKPLPTPMRILLK